VNYCLKYPSHVEKMILVSPVGIPRNPYEQQDLEIDSISFQSSEDLEFSITSDKINEKYVFTVRETIEQPRPIPRWVKILWEAKISPFTAIRLPVVGPKIASGWTCRRFSHLPSILERQTLPRYAYQIFRLRGSGEFALSYILAPGAYARRPLVDRVHLLDRDSVLKKVVWVYGDDDWMDVEGGRDAVERMKVESEVIVVGKSGHNIQLDNPWALNDIVIREFEV
jgi:cardiolipin-specific phospholipase